MFNIIQGDDGTLFSSQISKMCLTATAKENGAGIVQQPCNNSSDLQQWDWQAGKTLPIQLIGTNLCIGSNLANNGEVWSKRLSAPGTHSATAVLFFNPNDSQSANITL